MLHSVENILQSPDLICSTQDAMAHYLVTLQPWVEDYILADKF